MICRLAATLLLLAPLSPVLPLPAQNDFDAAVTRWGAQPPEGFLLQLGLQNGPMFSEGELISVRIDYTTSQPRRYGQQPPPVIYTLAGFLLDPPTGGCGTLEQPCLDSAARLANRFDSLYRLDAVGGGLETDLNTYLPYLPPGTYRLAVVMIQQVFQGSDAASSTYGYSDPRQYLVSNPVSIEVGAADENWVSETLVAERQALLETLSQVEPDFARKERAARQIGAINHSEAHEVALEIMGGSREQRISRLLTRSLSRDLPPQQACELMRSRLSLAEQPLNLDYATTMGELCGKAEVPFPEELQSSPGDDPRRLEWLRRYLEAQARARQQAMAALAARLGDSDSPETASFAQRLEILKYGLDLLHNPLPAARERGGGEAAGQETSAELPAYIAREAVAVLDELPGQDAQSVTEVLDSYWPLLRKVNPEPALRGIIERLEGKDTVLPPGYQPYPWNQARRAAIRRFVEVNPQQGREVLLEELTAFRPAFDETLADLLPRDAVPPMDEEILDYLSRIRNGQAPDGASALLIISRYLTDNAAGLLKSMIQNPNEWCQPELMAYFLRAQPATAEEVLKRTPWDMHQRVDGCGLNWISNVPPLILTPPLEDYLIAHLQHEYVGVKRAAAQSLSLYGTARARQPLQAAYDYFHQYWNGKEADLERPGYNDGWFLETALRGAIARGRAWFTDRAELERLAADCMTARCRAEAREDLAHWQPPLRLEVFGPYPDGELRANIAHYRSVSGMDAIRQRLAQFPEGTEFRLQVFALRSERERIATELRAFAAAAGLVLR